MRAGAATSAIMLKKRNGLPSGCIRKTDSAFPIGIPGLKKWKNTMVVTATVRACSMAAPHAATENNSE